MVIECHTELPHLDSNQDTPVPNHFDKGHTVVRVLVERLMEEDHPSNAAVDAIVCAEENLPVLSAVLLCVLHSDLGQPLGHAACSEHVLGEIHSRCLCAFCMLFRLHSLFLLFYHLSLQD